MHASAGEIPDDVPIADAAEQQRSTADYLSNDAIPAAAAEREMPLGTSAADWQEQREGVLIDPEFVEPDR